MLFKIFKKIAGILGYKLIDKDLIKNERELSNNSYYSLEKILHNLLENHLIEILIQIGSNDGKRFDNLNQFIKKYSPKSILVEPIKKNFDDLKKNYVYQTNIFFENSAISVNNEINSLFKVDDKKLDLYDEHIKGITSFRISHLLKHGVSKSHIVEEKVNSLSIKHLLEKYSIDKLDLLMIDTEGYDAQIAIDFLSNNSLRPFIILEYIHINHEVFKKLLRTLETEKYQYIKIDENLFCSPKEFQNLKKIF